MSDITITIRHHREAFVAQRRADLAALGFQVSDVTADPFGAFEFKLDVDFSDAHRLERGDDRWPVANLFFQRAEIAENHKGWYATLANDWASFGYKTRSLEGALNIEHARQAAFTR